MFCVRCEGFSDAGLWHIPHIETALGQLIVKDI